MQENFIQKAFRFAKVYIDFKMAILGSIFMGGVVFFINFDHGIGPALTAASKQGAYTFMFGGFIMRFVERLAVTPKNQILAISMAVIIPSILTIAATYGVHSLKGTPEPFFSTLPVILTAPPSFTMWAWRKRKKKFSENQEEAEN